MKRNCNFIDCNSFYCAFTEFFLYMYFIIYTYLYFCIIFKYLKDERKNWFNEGMQNDSVLISKLASNIEQIWTNHTAQKMKFSIQDFFHIYWRNSLIENIIFCLVYVLQSLHVQKFPDQVKSLTIMPSTQIKLQMNNDIFKIIDPTSFLKIQLWHKNLWSVNKPVWRLIVMVISPE